MSTGWFKKPSSFKGTTTRSSWGNRRTYPDNFTRRRGRSSSWGRGSWSRAHYKHKHHRASAVGYTRNWAGPGPSAKHPKQAITTLKGDNPIPDRLRCKLRYADASYVLELKGGAVSRTNYAINGPYDPYLSTGGATASEYTELMANYNRCIARGASISVIITNTDHTQDWTINCCLVALPNAGNTFASLTMDNGKQQRYSQYRELTSSFGSKSQVIIKDYQSVKAIQGVPIANDSDYQATSSANPGVIPYWQLLIQCPQAAGTPATSVPVNVDVVIEYYCEFMIPKPASTSFVAQAKKELLAQKVLELEEKERESELIAPIKRVPKRPVLEHKGESDDMDEKEMDLEFTTLNIQTPERVELPKAAPKRANSVTTPLAQMSPASPPPRANIKRTYAQVHPAAS